MKTLKVIRRIFLILIVVLIVLFVGLNYWTYHTDDYRYYYRYSIIRNDAYCDNIHVKKGDTNVVILDKVKGKPVTGLGRDIGSDIMIGAFNVSTDSTTPKGAHYAMWSADIYPQEDEHCTVVDSERQTLVINLYLGANISKIYATNKWFRGYVIEENYNHYTAVIHTKIVFNCTVSENNATFFAENGKLYYKETGNLFEGFFYE